MAKFKETSRQEIGKASPAELARQAAFNAFAFGGDSMGGGPSSLEITDILRRLGGLQELTPAMRLTIERATTGGLARGFAPQMEAATNQISNILAARGVRGSTGQLYAGVAAPLAQALTGASRQAAELEIGMPFQLQQAGIQRAGAFGDVRSREAGFAQFSLQRDLQERSQNVRRFERKRGFWGRLGAALGGVALGGLTGGLGAAVAGGIGGLFGGGGGSGGPAYGETPSAFRPPGTGMESFRPQRSAAELQNPFTLPTGAGVP